MIRLLFILLLTGCSDSKDIIGPLHRFAHAGMVRHSEVAVPREQVHNIMECRMLFDNSDALVMREKLERVRQLCIKRD